MLSTACTHSCLALQTTGFYFAGIAPVTSLSANNVVAPAAAPVTDEGLLVNVLGDIDLTSTAPSQNSTQSITPGAEEGFARFLFKNNGVLFENDTLQIGVKTEYKKNLGKILLETSMALNFTVFLYRSNCHVLWQ